MGCTPVAVGQIIAHYEDISDVYYRANTNEVKTFNIAILISIKNASDGKATL